MAFRDDFVWGAATAAFQIEGAWNEGGKGASIWDVFCHEGTHIKDGSSGDVACDHFHRYKDDVALMAALGLRAYRFSVAWSRVFAFDGGTAHVNQAGVDFYNALIDELLAHGITPYLTLYHWDLPYELYLRGGWLNRDSADWFRDYAQVVATAFGDRVRHVITFNEPSIFVGCGYMQGVHAPGYRLGTSSLLTVCHNIQRAHGMAVQTIRAAAPQTQVGITLATSPVVPGAARGGVAARDGVAAREADVRAAYDDYFYCGRDNFMWAESAWLDPIVLGRYPQRLVDECAALANGGEEKSTAAVAKTVFNTDDLAVISTPIDFIGLNIYSGRYGAGRPRPLGAAHTDIGWDVTPEALAWGCKHISARYGLPIYITENGIACHDWVSLDGAVHDPNRIDFLHRYLLSLRAACDEGVDIRGYFQWSLLDNFEWAEGYEKRFGMVYCDYTTQRRIPKDSAYWYQQVIATNGASL